jgi:hypothetical protein
MAQAAPEICYLAHPGFRMLGEPVFRLSEGARVPSMVVQLESQDAVLPLRSVAREFKLDPERGDGRMLGLIEQALDFVVSVRLGDKLPSELYGGEASWEPSTQDRLIAASKVRHNLVRCVFARMRKTVSIKGGAAPGWEEDAQNRMLLQQAVNGAAAQIEGSSEGEIETRVEALNNEMAYIECMRRTLIRGINGPREKLLRIKLGELPIARQETVKQVQTLARRGLAEITNRFDAVDQRLDDVLAMVRDLPPAVAWLRAQRNWQFRTNHAWTPVFTDWAHAPGNFDDFLWKVVERTYMFLAPRFMSFQEWNIKDTRVKEQAMRADTW